jgi:hypothetical protein
MPRCAYTRRTVRVPEGLGPHRAAPLWLARLVLHLLPRRRDDVLPEPRADGHVINQLPGVGEDGLAAWCQGREEELAGRPVRSAEVIAQDGLELRPERYDTLRATRLEAPPSVLPVGDRLPLEARVVQLEPVDLRVARPGEQERGEQGIGFGPARQQSAPRDGGFAGCPR